MKNAVQVTCAPTGRPFQSAAGALNTYLLEHLTQLGYRVDAVTITHDECIPYWAPVVAEQLRAAKDVDLAVYCDLAQWIEPLELLGAKRSLIFFHGMMGAPLAWLSRSNTILCGNSRWTSDVIKSIGGLPMWSLGRVARPEVFHRSQHVTCALPALENVDLGGAESPITAAIRERGSRGDEVLGMDFFYEADNLLHCLVMLALNMTARQHGDRRAFLLVVTQLKYSTIELGSKTLPRAQTESVARALKALNMTLADLYVVVPVTRVPQPDIFRIMESVEFSLAFNTIPESFGLLPLENVIHGCPVYSNGSGNIRHLLPSGHGIVIDDAEGLATYSVDDILRVASLIYEDVAAPGTVSPTRRHEELKRGADLIRQRYSLTAFRESLSAVLDWQPQDPPELADLVLTLSPVVRRWNTETGRILSDFKHCSLTLEESRRLRDLVGRSAAELFRRGRSTDQELISSLWARGLLAWNDRSTSAGG